jgi:hypothetical protein
MDTARIGFSYDNCMDFPVVHVILEIPFCMERLKRRFTLLLVQRLVYIYVGRV